MNLPTRPHIFSCGSYGESVRSAILRSETVGGALLLAATGLLAIFFFVAGLELKRDFVAGDLRNLTTCPEALKGWAIPTATDIAFTLAVLSVISTYLPSVRCSFLLPLAFATWALAHASSVHATVARVLLGFMVPNLLRDKTPENGPGLAGIKSAFTDSVAIGIVVALVAGKVIGVFGATWPVTKTTNARLHDGLSWIDVAGLALLAGVGFTVSLLISELSFGGDSPHYSHAKVAILTGSVLSALLTSIVLRLRNRHYRKVAELEELDEDHGGIPDVFQQGDNSK